MASGDAISQFVIERKSLRQYDGYRTSRFFLFGIVILVCIVFAAMRRLCISDLSQLV